MNACACIHMFMHVYVNVNTVKKVKDFNSNSQSLNTQSYMLRISQKLALNWNIQTVLNIESTRSLTQTYQPLAG